MAKNHPRAKASTTIWACSLAALLISADPVGGRVSAQAQAPADARGESTRGEGEPLLAEASGSAEAAAAPASTTSGSHPPTVRRIPLRLLRPRLLAGEPAPVRRRALRVRRLTIVGHALLGAFATTSVVTLWVTRPQCNPDEGCLDVETALMRGVTIGGASPMLFVGIGFEVAALRRRRLLVLSH